MATILITGVTSGIGRALAKEFSHLGHSVIGCGKNKDKVLALQHELQNAFISTVDVRDADAVAKWADETYAKYPQIDVIINNAGTKSALLPLWQVTANDFANTINTNLVGVANVIRSFVPNMVKLGAGTIINMSSEWGRVADACVASYCATKYAIEGLTGAFSKELPEGMITIALSPLIVYTELLERCKGLLLPGEYELGITPDKWATFVIPKIFALTKADNGKSLTWSPNA